jgi:hypothetical protein
MFQQRSALLPIRAHCSISAQAGPLLPYLVNFLPYRAELCKLYFFPSWWPRLAEGSATDQQQLICRKLILIFAQSDRCLVAHSRTALCRDRDMIIASWSPKSCRLNPAGLGRAKKGA